MPFTQPLNLEQILVYDLAGSFLVFSAIAILVISMLSARFRLTGSIFLLMIALFFSMMYVTSEASATFLGLMIAVVILSVIWVGISLRRLVD